MTTFQAPLLISDPGPTTAEAAPGLLEILISPWPWLGLVVLAVLVLALLWRQLLQAICNRRVRKLTLLVEERPHRVEKSCGRICRLLEWLAGRRGLAPRGAAALAQAHVLLAILDNRAGRVTSALQRLDRVRELYPSGAEQRRLLLRFYVLTSRTAPEAIACCMEYFLTAPPPSDGLSRDRVLTCFRALCAVRPGMETAELEERVRWNQEAQKVLSGEAWPRVNEGQAFHRLKRHDRARRVFEEILVQHPHEWTARAGLARALFAQNEPEPARRELATLLEAHPSDPDVLLEAAAQRALMQDLDGAEDLVGRIPEGDTTRQARVAILRACIALQHGKPEEARAHLERAMALNAGDVQAGRILAEVHSVAGEHLQAVAVLAQTIPPGTTDPELQFALACALFNAGRFGEAAEWLERCARVNYRPQQVPLLRVRCLIRAGKAAEAVQLLQEARDLNPDSAEVAFYRGVALYRAGTPRQAVNYFTLAYNLARKAEDKTLAMRAGVNLTACFNQVANGQVRAKKYAQAAQTFEVLRNYLKPAHPYYSPATKSLSECYVRQGLEFLSGRQTSAVKQTLLFLEKALPLGVNNLVKMLLAGLYVRERKPEQALALYDEMLKAAPNQEALQFARALTASRISDGTAGTFELQKICDGSGRYAIRAALALSAVEAEAKRYEQAVALLYKAANLSGARQNKYFGEASCRATLYALRGGDEERARGLATELLAEGNPLFAELLLV
jgi:tetratricopeptide (TPR) repeat protein